MSNTRRKTPVSYVVFRGDKILETEIDHRLGTVRGDKLYYATIFGHGRNAPCAKDYGITSRDGKPAHKAPSALKRILRQEDRSRSRQAMREGKEPERIRKYDDWEWM